jgi:5-hydroxyisourate hydrolase-like protein (transthyretin family)
VIARMKGVIVSAVMVLLAAGTAMAGAGQQPTTDGRFLGREEIRLYGLNLTVTPAEQVVPKDIATIVSTFLQAPAPTEQTVSPFASDAEVRATLRGPSFATPLELAVKPGNPFNIPAMKIPGIHTLDNIRLVSHGQVLLRGNPESARIEVIEKLLVSQVTARALTADEIREKGIVFDRSNFQAYNFSAAFAIQDTPITINFPVLLPRLTGAELPDNSGVSIPSVSVPTIPQLSTIIPDTLKLQTRLPNLQVVGFSLKIPDVENGNFIVPPIPGIIAIPGDIGFLNQYFSVLLMVGNVAPAGSGLVVSELSAEILLPSGRDNVPNTPDDPLRMAMTSRGESQHLQVVAQPGPDGRLGTADDIATIGPGQSGNAEYLVEGRREGSHIVEMRMHGTLNGLPIGPVPINGVALGSVLVRNPTFALTFTHPEVVSAGEKYTLDVTVTNSSASPANFVSVNLDAAHIGGAKLAGEPPPPIDSIAPGDSATVSFTLEAKLTGRVFAATLDADEGVTGQFGLKTSVGELGVPLSPDSLVLPKEASTLPKPLRDAAIGLLGKAWAVATAPAAAVPADLVRFSRKIVLDRAVEVAEAGLRLSLKEPLRDSATQLALDFLGSNFPRLNTRVTDAEGLAFEQNNFIGFDLLRRRSIRGDVFADAVAALLRDDLALLGAAAFHGDVASKISYRPGTISVLASTQSGAVPVRLAIVDAAGRRTGGADANGKVIKEIAFSDVLAFKDTNGTLTAEMAIVGAPDAGPTGTGTFTVRLTRAPDVPDNTPFTLSLVVPGANDELRQIVFENLVVGQRPVMAFATGAPYRLVVEWANASATADVNPSADAVLPDPAPSVVSVIQNASADQILCEQDALVGPRPGRIVAVLFSEEVTPASVQDKAKIEAITNYAIDGNAVVGVALQPGRRIAYLALRDPFGPLVPRNLTINNVTDARGHALAPQTLPMQATVTDDAGIVSGQVLKADGTPAAYANVRLFYRSPCETAETQWIGISSKTTDANGRYSWDFVLTALPARIVAVDAESGDVRDVRFHVRSNGQRLDVNVVFLGRGTVTGRTFAADGRTPLADTFVRVTSLTDQSQFGARTDSAGRYTIANVPVGNIVIDAVNTAAVAKTTESDLIPFAGATTTRDLILLDASHEPITIKRGNLSGFVLESDTRTPARGVPVIVYYQSNSQPSIPCPKSAPECPVAVATTDANGAFQFPNVVAGSLRLQTFNQSSYEQGEVGIVLAANQTRSANIILSGGLGTVTGIVMDPSGKPVAGASVGGGLSLATTGQDGRFTLNDVPVGHREIVAVSTELGSRASVTVDLLYGGQTVNATLVLDALASVSGVITRTNGTPASGIQVYVFDKHGDSVQVYGSAVTNDQGGYRIDGLPLGEHSVSAFTADFSDGNLVQAVLKFHRQVVRADVQFRGGGGRVTGRVFADDGATPLRARVSVSGEQVVVAGGVLGVEFRRVENFRIVDTNLTTGKYSIAGLFVGPFTLRAAGPFSPDPIAVEAQMPAPGQEIVVDLKLQPTSQLTGTVFMPDGQTPVGANVPVHFKSDSFKTICTESSTGESTCQSFPQGVQGADAVTDATGAFLFPVLNAGTYTLTVDGPGGRTATVKGSLVAGQQGRADVRLLGRAEIKVHVFAADATTRIPGARVDVSQVGAPLKKASFTADATGEVSFGGADAFSEGEFVIVSTDLRNGATGRARGRITTDGVPVSVDVFLSTSSGVVFGRVQRPDRATPVPNAEVIIFSGNDAVAFNTTNELGQYREVGIPLGPVRVEVFEAATARRGAASGQLATNGAQIELNVVEEALGVVRGRVVAAVTLQPLVGWRVTVNGVSTSGRPYPSLVGTTGIDGGFSFPGTPLGQFTINASKPGQPGSGSAQGSIVREGELVDVPVIATIPRQAVGTFTGTVVDHVGEAVANARVEVFAPGVQSGPSAVITADSNGRFAYGPAPLGRYNLRAFRQGSTESGAASVELSFDGQSAGASVVLNGLSTVTGVVMQNNAPVPNARVTIKGQPDVGCGSSCSGFANGSGQFTFERISARSFTVLASNASGTLSGSTGDILNPGETKTISVVLEATRKLSGRVLNAAQLPVAGVVGEVVIGSRHFFAETAADGAFEFAALPLGAFKLDLRDATGPGMAARLGTIANDVLLGDVVLDEAPPRVSGVTPLPSAVAVPRAQAITLVFSEPIDRASISTESVQLAGPSGSVLLGTPVYRAGDSEVVFQPVGDLQPETRYTLTVTGVRDRAGRPMLAAYATSFTTVDISAPTLVDASPASGANGVSAFTTIRLRYSEALTPPALQTPPSQAPAVQLLRGATPVEGSVDFILGNTVVVFTPNMPLDEDATYRVIASAAMDQSGNKQPQGLDYTFSTTDRTPPQVLSLVAAGDGTVIENGLTEVTATVGNTHDVAYVDFYLNDQIAFSARSAPFRLVLKAVPALGAPGASIKVSALATDTSGNRSIAPATILVPIKPDAPPAVTLLAPAAGTSVPNGSPVHISLRATDDLGLTQVGYRATIGQTVRTGVRAITPSGTETTQAFDFAVPADAAPGAIVKIEPTALDSKGQAIVGAAVEVRVLDAAPPKVTITGVTSGARVRPGQTTTVVVSATDAGLVRTVTFTASGAATFTQTRTIEPAQGSVAASFTFTVPESAKATETITLAASAKDSAGNEADAPNVILPIADLVAPTITLRTSTGRNEMSPGSPLVIIAEANDEVGVGRIELTGSGAFPVAEGRTIDPPTATAEVIFTILVPEPVPDGAVLQLQARAIDGAQNVSTPTSLTVTAGAAIGVTLPASAIINAGSTQTIDVALSAAAGASGVRVDLSTENAAIATVSTPVLFAQGETSKTATISAHAGGSTTVIASVQGIERARMTVTVQGGIVTGVVRDPELLQPVAGALVTVNSGGTTRTATSGADGRYTVQGLPGPSVEVRALDEASGLYGVSRGTMAANGFLDLDVILLDAGSISGIVRGANTQPVGAGVQVTITASNSSTPEQTVFTNQDGEYEFPLVTVGSYRLDASDAAGNRGTTTVAIVGGQQLAQDIVFLGRGTVRGIVKTAGGDAVPGAALTFSSTSLFGTTSVTRTSDNDGKFAFTGVFVGTFHVTASRAATGEAGTASGAIAADQGVADITVTLSPVGSLAGVVRRVDTSTVPGATVTVGASSTTTDPEGKYSFAFLPAGAFKAIATVAGTREQGLARGTVVAGQPATLDIVLVPQGRLQVTVKDGDNHEVDGATITVNVSVGAAPDQLSDTLHAITGANGVALIDRVMAGSYQVIASANGVTAYASGTLAAGETKPVAIKLQQLATVTGTVFEPGGLQPVSRGYVTIRDFGYVAIAPNGTYTFTDVPRGTYKMTASVDSMTRAQANAVVVPATGGPTGGIVTQNFELVGLGTVKGRVMNGGNPMPNLWVQVVSQHPDFGHTQNVRTNEGGYYEAIGMVLGSIAVSAGSDTLRGEASGTLASTTVPLTLDILMTNNATTLPQTLSDANASRFDMQTNGGLGTQSGGFYNAFLLDIIAGGTPVRFTGAGIPTTENGGREIATRQSGVAGLNVTRKMFVPSAGYFGRWLEILSNPTAAPITVDVRVTSLVGTNLAAHPVASIIATSSGDTVLDVTSPDTADRWIVLDDAKDNDPNLPIGGAADSGIPAVAFVFDGAGGAQRAGQATLTIDPNSSLARNTMTYTWQSVTIPAGQSVALMHFGVRQMSRAGATASADRLAQLPPEAIAGLNPDEIPLVRNFAVSPNGNSPIAPLPPVTGKVTGKVLAGDGTTPIASVQAKFKSDSLFFGRTYTLTASIADGTFALQGAQTSTSQIAVSSGDSFTLTARHPESQVDAPPVTGAFADGETLSTRDVVFSNTGLVQGLVKRHNGTPVTTGAVTLTVGSIGINRTIGATSSFLYTGIPAGGATLKATHTPSGASGTSPSLTGTAAITVTAGQKTTQDVLLESTGAVTGLVRTAADAPAIGVTVYLERTGFARSTTTDSAGRYTFANAPAGDLTVRAVEPATQVSTSIPVTIPVDGPPLEAPVIKLMGYGTLNVQVTYVGGTPVGSGVTVQLTEVARGSTRSYSTNGSGQVTATNVTTAGHTIKAIVPNIGAQSLPVDGTIAHGETKGTTIAVPGLGLVTARVRFPSPVPPGVAPGVVPVDIYSGSTRNFNTNAAGDVTIPYVTTGRTFTLTAYTSAAKTAYRQTASQTVAEGQNLTVDVTLPALATLAVTLEQGDPARVGAKVSIRDAFSYGYGTPVTVNQAGTASFANTPEGRVLIAVTSASGVLLAEAEATIRPADHGKTVEVQIGSGVPLPAKLTDANSFDFNVGKDGRIDGGYSNGMELRLTVDGSTTSFVGSSLAQLEAGGRELVIRDTNPASGLEVTRKVFVPKTGYFARYLEIVRNPGTTPVTVDLEVASELWSGSATVVPDQVAGAWIVTDDDNGEYPWPMSDPTLAHVYAGQNAAFAPPATVLPPASNGALEYRWNGIAIQPGQTVAVMHFAVQQPSQTAATASATRLAQLPPEALADLSAAEIAAIGNFAVPADGVGTVPPLNLVEAFTVSGQLFTWNGTTPVNANNTVTLRSGNPIYSRGTTATVGASYSVTGTVVDSWTLEANNLPPAPFEGWQTPRQATRTLEPGQTSATEDITFSGTGSLTGRVRFGNDAPATTGSLIFSLAGGHQVGIQNFANGAFSIPVVPAGAYSMTANVSGRTVTVPFTVAPDANGTVDVRLPSRASVHVRVTTPSGAPAAGADVSINHQGGWKFDRADGNGEYTFTNVAEGEFYLNASDAAGRPAYVTGTVLPADEGRLFDVPLPLRGLVTMRVTATRGGQPVADQQVRIQHGDDTSGFSHFGSTDAQGRVLAENIQTGGYQVQVLNADGSVIVGTAAGSIPATSDGQTIDVPVALSTRSAHVTGTLFAGDGQTRLRNYEVGVRLFDGAREIGNSTTQNGSYDLTDVPVPSNGTLRVRIHYPAWDTERFVEADVTVSDGQTTTHDFTLPINGVTGTVRLWDGSKPAYASVNVSFGDEASYSSGTDENGRYVVFDVPVYRFVARTRVGELFGRIGGVVQGPTDMVTADFVFGKITGTVHYADGTPVPDPSVFALQTVGPDDEETYSREPMGTDGAFVILGPQPGPVTVIAQDQMLEGQATVTLSSGTPTADVHIQLEPDGTISGTVFDQNDVPAAGATVVLSITGLERWTTTDVNGRFTFERTKLGAFLLQASIEVNGQPQFVAATGMLAGQPAVVDVPLKLPKTVALSGKVLQADGTTLVPNADVKIENRDHAGALGWFVLNAEADATGTYTAASVPVGQVKVTAFDGTFGGSTTAAVTESGPAAIDVKIGSLVKLSPNYVMDSAGFRFDITCDGRIYQGGRMDGYWWGTFVNAFRMSVNSYQQPCITAAGLEDNGRELSLDGGMRDGLHVTRKIYVPASGGFARYLEVVTNPGATARAVRVDISGGHGNWSQQPAVVTSPSTTGNTYAVSQFASMGSVGFVFAGQNSVVPAVDAFFSTNPTFSYAWNVTVQPGQTVALMHFALQGGANGGAALDASAREFAALTRPGMLDGLSAEEKAWIVNFRMP